MRKSSLLFLTSIVLFLSSCHLFNEKDKKRDVEEGFFEESEEAEDGMEKWMEQNAMMTKDPALGYVPYGRLEAAQAYTRSLIGNANLRTNALAWTERGPNNVGGRTRALFIDKRDATGNTVFAGSVGGGLWKTTNFKSSAVTWSPINDQLANLSITALAQDPSNLNVMYAGTGEGWFNLDAIMGNGIFKSTDGGVTWTQLSSTINTSNALATEFAYVQDIVVNASGIVFAATRGYYCNYGGVFRSSDAGSTWTRVLGTFSGGTSCTASTDQRAADLEIAANGDIYATTGFGSTASNYLGKIYKSPASLGANIGTTGNWTSITPTGSFQRIEIALAPSNANILYGLFQNGTSSGIGSIRRSSDGGATWSITATPSWCNQGSTSTDFTNNQAWYDLIAAVDPNDAGKLFVGGVDVLKSVDSGSNWSQVTQWSSGCTGLPNIHADNHNITFYPNSSNEIIAANDGGIYYSSDGGATWVSKNNNFNVTQFYACDMHPTNANYFLAGAQDNGSHRFTSAGINSTTRVTGGDGAFCHIDQTDGNIQVTSYVYNNYYYSRNGGTSFATVTGSTSNSGFFINPTDYDDALDVLYTSAAANTYGLVSNLNATTAPYYSAVSLSDLGGKRITAIKVDPNVTGGGTVWMVGSNSATPVFIKVANANTTAPIVVTSISPSGFTSGCYVSNIDVENGNPNHLLATVTNYGAVSVLESTDGGQNWTNIEGNLPDMPIRWGIFAPSNALLTNSTTAAGGIILATETGIWVTSATNGSATTWVPQNTGLANVSCYMLQYRASDRTLAVATHGRGLFTTVLPSLATAIDPVSNTKNFITYASANSNTLFVKVGSLTNVKNIQMGIYDMQGRLLANNKYAYSNQTVPISNLPKGGYVLKIYGSNKEQYTQQFVKY